MYFDGIKKKSDFCCHKELVLAGPLFLLPDYSKLAVKRALEKRRTECLAVRAGHRLAEGRGIVFHIQSPENFSTFGTPEDFLSSYHNSFLFLVLLDLFSAVAAVGPVLHHGLVAVRTDVGGAEHESFCYLEFRTSFPLEDLIDTFSRERM